MVIRRLPKDVVDRIAAGEVIERPSSVVKELVENALDAGARQVDVTIEGGGKRSLTIADDGCGMSAEDLALAFVPHATSKLSAVDDLLEIASFGFRGEALASVGAVARARIVSRPTDGDGHEVVCDGGVTGEVRPCGASPGTTVHVKNLFFNIPARARFMKSDAAEAARCLDQVVRAALAHVGVGFSFTHAGRTVFRVPPDADRRTRVGEAYGHPLASKMIAVERPGDGVRVEGLLGPPDVAKGRTTHQAIFLNGRPIVDPAIRAAVRQAYREFLAPSLVPVFVLFLGIDPGELDVNVHPAKTEVRFRDPSRVFRAVHHAVVDALRRSDLSPRPRVGPGGPGATSARPLPRESWNPRDASGVAPSTSGAPGATGVPGEPAFEPAAEPASQVREVAASAGRLFGNEEAPVVPAVPERTGSGWLRVFSTYILYESGGELILVDQHALHERVLYERLRRSFRDGAIPGQRLLVPAVVEVGRAAVLRAEDLAEPAARLGVELTAFSPTAVAVHSLPALLKDADAAEVLSGLLADEDDSAGAGTGAREPLDHRLHTMACHGAVRAGDVLADLEIESLLDQAARIPEAKACPHGRPTSLRIGRGDLESWFKRSGF